MVRGASKAMCTAGVIGAAMAVHGALAPVLASDGVVAELVGCKAVADDRERLRCLDAVLAAIGQMTSAQARSESVESLERRERDLARRELELNARSEAVHNAASSFGSTPPSGDVDSFTTAAAGLPQHEVERDTDGVVEAISANIREWSYNGRGQVIVMLENGQVWRQTDNVGLHLSAGRTKPHRVRIARAALGSFTMTVDGNNQGYKVRRVNPAKG